MSSTARLFVERSGQDETLRFRGHAVPVEARISGDAAGRAAGSIDRGAELWLLEHRGERVRVLPHACLMTPVGATWWLPVDAVGLE